MNFHLCYPCFAFKTEPESCIASSNQSCCTLLWLFFITIWVSTSSIWGQIWTNKFRRCLESELCIQKRNNSPRWSYFVWRHVDRVVSRSTVVIYSRFLDWAYFEQNRLFWSPNEFQLVLSVFLEKTNGWGPRETKFGKWSKWRTTSMRTLEPQVTLPMVFIELIHLVQF